MAQVMLYVNFDKPYHINQSKYQVDLEQVTEKSVSLKEIHYLKMQTSR